MDVIRVEGLVREFPETSKANGSLRNLRSWFAAGKRMKRVVDGIEFRVGKGEFVGYLGPNGAGKSTTIKMLSGVLVPTSGRIVVNGIEPWQKRKQHAKSIGVLFGQRTQLWWDLPLIESFKLLKEIYRIPSHRFQDNLKLFADILDMEPFLQTPVRQLSLGQRMRGDLAASLLHDPEIFISGRANNWTGFSSKRENPAISQTNQ